MIRAVVVVALVACSACTERLALLTSGDAEPWSAEDAGAVPPLDSAAPTPSAMIGPERAICTDPPLPPSIDGIAVTAFGDGTPGSCTAPALADKVRAGGRITFNCGPAPVTIALAAELTIANDAFLDGGENGAEPPRVSVRAPPGGRAFVVAGTADRPTVLALRSVEVLGTATGRAAIQLNGGELFAQRCRLRENTYVNGSGGAIAGDGTVTLLDSLVEQNAATHGGAISLSRGKLTLTRTVIRENRAANNGGGVHINASQSRVDVCGSTFERNFAGTFGGGIYVSNSVEGSLHINQSIIANNQVAQPGPREAQAGAIFAQGTHVTLTRSTVSGNVAPFVAGIWVGRFTSSTVAAPVPGKLTMENVTLAGNRNYDVPNLPPSWGTALWFAPPVSGTVTHCTIAGNVGGSRVGLYGDAASVTLVNSIVANEGVESPRNCEHEYGGARNLQWPSEPAYPCAAHTVAAEPMLEALAWNGGPTPTMRPRAGSPALGRGTNCLTIDQKGQPRSAEACALGAYEPSP